MAVDKRRVAMPDCWSPVRKLASELADGCQLQKGAISLKRDGDCKYTLALRSGQKPFTCPVKAVFMFIYYAGGPESIEVIEYKEPEHNWRAYINTSGAYEGGDDVVVCPQCLKEDPSLEADIYCSTREPCLKHQDPAKNGR